MARRDAPHTRSPGGDDTQAVTGATAFKRGIEISDAQFSKLASLVYRLCGINLGDSKRELLKARLAKRLRATGAADVRQYLTLLENDPKGQELINFLDSITTNKTDFFREPAHFDILINESLPKTIQGGRGGTFRIWSAACSTGEEPYTLAISLLNNREAWAGTEMKILASDICTQALEHAQRAVYAQERVARIPKPILKNFFQKGKNRWEGHVRVRPEVRSLVDFRRINLMDQFKFSHPFQVIFCRNVMIYFDKPTQERLVDKFYGCLAPGGYLFVGHSESLTGIKHRLGFVRPAVYRKEV